MILLEVVCWFSETGLRCKVFFENISILFVIYVFYNLPK